MPAFFLDTSTVLKRYVLETGTPWVQALAEPAAGHSLIIVRITLAETVAALTRKERGGSITPKDAATALADFQLDFARQYFIIEVSATLVTQAASLARKHALRGYDAVQLAAALDTRTRLPSLTLLSADADLNAAALAEGLAVDDPNSHPSTAMRGEKQKGRKTKRVGFRSWPLVTPGPSPLLHFHLESHAPGLLDSFFVEPGP